MKTKNKALVIMSKLFTVLAFTLIIFQGSISSANALNSADSDAVANPGSWVNWVPNSGVCAVNNTAVSNAGAGASNLDYAGRPILTQVQLQTIQANQQTYMQAAQQGNIPWQMLAVIHLRETGLSMTNPGNGQGLYQITSGGFPPGPVSPSDFLAQSIKAAQFISSAASSNYPSDRNLTAGTVDPNTIKDTFFSYNGRASAYAQQAAQNGFDPNTQGFEGSPYVMNKADAKRDPSALGPNEQTWGQIKTDGGGISYPANDDYGAYVEFVALAGGSTTGACSGTAANCTTGAPSSAQGLSNVRQDVVCVAEQEYAKWSSNPPQLTAQSGYLTYSQNVVEEWCADFASWVYNQATYPLQPDPNWRVSYVPNIQAIGEREQNFHWHPAAGYTPKPGDLAIHGPNHVNIVVGVSNGVVTLIGGDEGHGPYPGGSVVAEDNYTADVTGYVSPD
jgi:hypothetical protein